MKNPAALALTNLGPIAAVRAGRLGRRLPQLLIGLALYGISIALMVRGGLGLSPWDVLHAGLARHLGLTIGQTLIGVSFLVLLSWIPLREKPGVGTVLNAVLIGFATDGTLRLLAAPQWLVVRIAFTVGGILLCAFATALYIGAQFGRGPRDGLMTGIHYRAGWSLRLVRTGIEVTALLIGLALGGSVGVGTILFAVAIGPLTQLMLPRWIVTLDET